MSNKIPHGCYEIGGPEWHAREEELRAQYNIDKRRRVKEFLQENSLTYKVRQHLMDNSERICAIVSHLTSGTPLPPDVKFSGNTEIVMEQWVALMKMAADDKLDNNEKMITKLCKTKF